MDENTLKSMHDLVAKHFEPTVLEVEAGKVIVTSNNSEVHDLEEIIERAQPYTRRPMGHSTHHTLASLIAHAKRYKDDDAVAFCSVDVTSPGITTVYDYHPVQENKGGHRDFKAHYSFPFSTQWKRWTSKVGKQLSVKDFAELLEDGIGDIATPGESSPQLPGVRYATGAELLTLAEGLTVRIEQRVVNQRKADNGTTTLVFSEEHSSEKGEPLKIPNGFLLGIPIFTGGVPYGIPVRLRYRVANGAVAWSIALHNADRCLEDAIAEAANKFAAETGLPVFTGTSDR
jgi:uncharacterized protein YfdQ (DUF2303 family)